MKKDYSRVIVKMLSVLVLLTMLIQLTSVPAFAEVDYLDNDDSEFETEVEAVIGESDEETRNSIIDYDDDFEDDKVLVTFKKEYSDPTINVTKESFPGLDIINIDNYIISDPDEDFTRDISITINSHDKERVISICEELSQREDVLRVTPSYIYTCETYQVPNDPLYASYNTPFVKINAPSAWDITTGSSSVKVAVIDTKVDEHSDFSSNLTVGYDAHYENTVTNDCSSDHGTSVASIIGAKGNNNYKSTGVCWNVSIVPIQMYYDYENHKLDFNLIDLARAFSHLKQNGIQIANCSFGSTGWVNSKIEAFKHAVEDWGGILVASAGNELINTDVTSHYPSCIDSDNIISVAASNSTCTGLATATDWGWPSGDSVGSNYGVNSVDIVAPGTGIYILKESNGEATNGCGTSLAAPFVTGAAALLKSKYPTATSSEIIQAIEQGATSFDWTTNKVKYGFLNINNSLSVLETIMNNRKIVEDGTYVLGALNNSFQVLDINNSSMGNAVAAVMYESNGSDSQKFLIEYHIGPFGENYYSIKNVNSGKYLEAANGGITLGTIVQQNQWNGSLGQKWRLEESSNGSYKIINKKSGLAIDFENARPENNQSVSLQTTANAARQKFNLIISSEKVVISDGLYTVNIKSQNTLKISRSGSNYELDSQPTIFRIINDNGISYFTEYYGNKAIELSNDMSLKTSVEDNNSDRQKWIIKDCGDGTVYISSYINNRVYSTQNGETTTGANIVAAVPVGSDYQRFYITPFNSLLSNLGTGGAYSAALYDDNTIGIDLSTAACYDLNEGINNIEYHVLFIPNEFGTYYIKNSASGQYLENLDDGSVTFASPNESERQEWDIYKFSGVYYYENVYTERYLKYIQNVDGSVSLTSSENEIDLGYSNIVFLKYTSIQTDMDYLIIPKNDSQKAISFSGTVMESGVALTTAEIDFEDVGQIYTFKGIELDGYYYIKNSSGNLYLYVNSLYSPGTFSPGTLNDEPIAYTVIQTIDGYYKVITSDGGAITYINNYFYLIKQKPNNDDNQKFMLVPVTDAIANGTYQILLNDDQTKAISVGNSMDENSSISVEAADSTDNSQLFYVYKYGDGYRFVSLYSGNSMCLSSDFNTVTQKHFSNIDKSQVWQLLNTTSTDSNYSTKIISYRTGDYLWSYDNSLHMAYFDSLSDQLFILKRVPQFEDLAIGEIVSNSDTTKDISISGTTAVLSNISNNGRTTLRFTCDTNGLWSIVERTNDKVLDYSNDILSFNTSTGSDTQKWIIRKVSNGNYVIINLGTGKALKNDNVNLIIEYYSNLATQKFNIFVKGDINCDGIISAADLLKLRQFISGILEPTDTEVYCGDVNEDDDITMEDVLKLRRYLAGEIGFNSYLSPLSINANELHMTNSGGINDITIDDLLEMTDEEFLRYLFGDVDYNLLQIVLFD